MLRLFVFVCGLVVSQGVAQMVLDSLGRRQASSWCWSLLVQYVICLTLLVFIDNAPWKDALSPALALTCFVRIFYFIRNLKNQ